MNNSIMNIRIHKNNNFGDCCIEYFLNNLTNNKFNYVFIGDRNFAIHNDHYITVGSILTMCTDKSTVWGCGFIAKNSSMGTYSTFKMKNRTVCHPKFISVRGPLTHKKLIDMKITLPNKLYYGDPLMLFPLIINPNVEEIYDIGIIPHYVDFQSDNYQQLFSKLSKEYKVKYIDISTGNTKEKIDDFINQIKQCKIIISSSLHGAILGVAYNKKTIITKFSGKVIGGDFKFYDFLNSIKVFDYKILESNELDLNNNVNYDIQNVNEICKEIIISCPFLNEKQKEEYINKY